MLPLIHGSHFASLSPDATFFFSQLNLKWELPSQQKPLMSISSGVAELLTFPEGPYCPLAFWVALLVKLAPACTGCMFLSAAGLCLGMTMTAVSLRLDGSQLLFVFVCSVLYCLICLTWENWFKSCKQYFLLKWSLKKSDWREPFIFACYFFPCFWMANPSYMGNENIMEWQISNRWVSAAHCSNCLVTSLLDPWQSLFF